MPKATTRKETRRFDLETCEGGYVVIRRMDYGEHLKARELATTMRGTRGSNEAELSMGVSTSAAYNFSRSIVDHNLQDEDERKLDFTSRADLNKLDPVIAEEIEELIDKVNSRDTPEDMRPLALTSEASSSDGAVTTKKP